MDYLDGTVKAYLDAYAKRIETVNNKILTDRYLRLVLQECKTWDSLRRACDYAPEGSALQECLLVGLIFISDTDCQIVGGVELFFQYLGKQPPEELHSKIKQLSPTSEIDLKGVLSPEAYKFLTNLQNV